MKWDQIIEGEKDLSSLRSSSPQEEWIYFPSAYKKLKFSLEIKFWRNILYLILLGLIILGFRLFYLQIHQGNYLRQIAEGNRLRIEIIPSNRGLIKDEKGHILVENIPQFNLMFIPADLPKDLSLFQDKLQKIAQLSKVEFENLYNQLTKAPSYSSIPQLIKDNIDYENALKLESEIKDIPGFILNIKATRNYFYPESLSHVLGFLGKISEEEYKDLKDKNYQFDDFIGRQGLEAYYEEILRGIPGQKQIEVDSQGHELKKYFQIDPKQGKHLTLYIDADLQAKAYELLSKYIKKLSVPGGAVVILDAKTGGVKTLVSYPSFDSNKLTQGLDPQEAEKLFKDPSRPLFNRAISGEYPPGSTFKPIIALGALAEGIITPQTQILSQGGLKFDKWFFPDWKKGGHGLTDLTKALAESVNTYFYYIGGGYQDFRGLGVERIIKYAQEFGLGKKTGIDLPGEKEGFLPSKKWKEEIKKEKWYLGDTYHLSIGQGDILITPLQAANYLLTIVNDGKVLRPHLVKSIEDPSTNQQKNIKAEVIKKIQIDTKYFQAVKRGLRAAVVSGSARWLNNLPVTSAGKTGTAQATDPNKFHSWFIGYAPYEDPEIVISVVIEEGGESTQAALPLAYEILAWYFSQKR